jgi:hypothetical protein
MPRHRESLDSVKERLIREQKIRTDRKVRDLLHARQRKQDTEVSDDSEEENRLRLQRRRGNQDQATQTESSSSFSFFCGVLVGVILFFVHCFSCSRLVEMTEQGWRGKGGKVLRRSPRQRGKTCGRPFTAPRKVTPPTSNVKKRTVQTHKDDSEVQLLTESEAQTSVNLTKAVEHCSEGGTGVVVAMEEGV